MLALGVKNKSLLFLMGLLMLPTVLFAQIRLMDDDMKMMEIPSELQRILNTQTESPVNTITNWFAKNGFLNVDVTEFGESHYRVVEGCKFTALIQGLESETRKLPYSEGNIENVFKSALNMEVSEGRYFSAIEILSFIPHPQTCEVEIVVKLSSNELVYIRDMAVVENKWNSNSYLKKRSYFQDSLLATSENMAQIRFNLLQTELFESISDPYIVVNSEAPILQFKVEEQALNQFDGVLGYVPDANGSGQVVGDLSLSLWSVFADGNGVDLDYRRLEPEVSRLNLGVSQHWFGSVPLGLSAMFNLFQNDTTYQSREFRLDGYFELGNGLQLLGDVGFTSITGTNISRSTIEPGGKKKQASFGFRYSNIFGQEVPRKGFETAVRFGFVNKSTDIDSLSSFSQQFISATAENYLPVGKQGVIATRLNSFFLLADEFTDIDLRRFGGANTLRGFTEEQFQASQVVWGDVEYRFLTNPSSYLFGFAAAGWFHRPKLLTESNIQFKTTEFVESLGFGLSYKVRVGRLKFTYAMSPSDGLGNGKIHVALTTRL